MSSVVGFSAAGFAASIASTSRANVRACARTSNSSMNSQPAWRTLRMSPRVAGFAPAMTAVPVRPAPDSTVSWRTSVRSLVTRRLRFRYATTDVRRLFAVALDEPRVGVARAGGCGLLDRHGEAAIFQHRLRLDLGETARVPVGASERTARGHRVL